MKIERTVGSDYVIHYGSIEDLLADNPKTLRNQRLRDMTLGPTSDHGRGWYGPGIGKAPEFEERVKEGWPELTARVKDMASKLAVSPETLPVSLTQATRRRRVRTDNGSDLDIHAVYQGAIDRAWTNTRREVHQVRRKAAHVYVNIGGLGSEDALSSAWRAAVAYSVCDMLQRAGFTVEVTVGATATQVYNGIGMVHTSFTAKASTMPLDLNRLAIQSTLGWHRMYNFYARLCNDAGMECAHDMGYTAHDAVNPYIAECEKHGVLLIPISAGIHSLGRAKDEVQKAQRLIEGFTV